MSTDEIPIKI